MRRCFAYLAGMIFALALTAPAQGLGPEERYLEIYYMIQEADGLAAKSQLPKAAAKYTEAQAALKKLQGDFPEWHEKVVKYRLDYIASKLQSLAKELAAAQPPAPAPATNAAPGAASKQTAEAPGGTEIQDLRQQITQLTTQNAELQAKVKEALSVQPAAVDPKELAKAEEKIKALEKERDLLKTSLEQTATKKATEESAAAQEEKILAEVKQKLAQQTELAAALQKENDLLQIQLTALKSASTKLGSGSELAQELAITKMTLETLQQTNVALRTDALIKGQQLEELSKDAVPRSLFIAVEKERDTLKEQLSAFALTSVKGTAPVNIDRDELARQLAAAQAKLAAYEAKAVPFTPEEQALLKQPDKQREPDLKVSLSDAAPRKKKVLEFPPGAAPLVEEADFDMSTGKYDKAEKKFQDVLRQDEKNLYVLSHLAAAQMHQSRYDEADKTLQKAIAIDPEDGGTLSVMGQLRYFQEKYDGAIESLSLAAKAKPEDARVQYYLGKSMLQKGQRGSAEAALRKAVQLAPDWGEAHYWLAFIYATAQPPFRELARWHYYEKALKNGYAPNKEFEKLLDKKETTTAKP